MAEILNFPPIQMTRQTAYAYLDVKEVTFKKDYHPHLSWTKDGKNYMYLREDLDALVRKKHQDNLETVTAKANKPKRKSVPVRSVDTRSAFLAAADRAQGKK